MLAVTPDDIIPNKLAGIGVVNLGISETGQRRGHHESVTIEDKQVVLLQALAAAQTRSTAPLVGMSERTFRRVLPIMCSASEQTRIA